MLESKSGPSKLNDLEIILAIMAISMGNPDEILIILLLIIHFSMVQKM
jgi:hypothetical protein